MRAPQYPFEEPTTKNSLSPGLGSITVTKDDDNDLPFVARTLYVEQGGTLHFTGYDDAEDTWGSVVPIPDGSYINVLVKRIFEDSTVDGIHALK